MHMYDIPQLLLCLQANVPSIAAVTASMDPKCFIYNIELSVQTPKVR